MTQAEEFIAELRIAQAVKDEIILEEIMTQAQEFVAELKIAQEVNDDVKEGKLMTYLLTLKTIEVPGRDPKLQPLRIFPDGSSYDQERDRTYTSLMTRVLF